MRQITRSITINASKEDVWDITFNRFGEVNNFNPLIEASVFTKGTAGEVGCERMCTIDSKSKVYERISRAEIGKNFDIEIFEGGLPMMDKMMGRFDIIELSDNQIKAEFTMNYSTKPAFMGGIMKSKMSKFFFKFLIGLKYHLETGELVTKENIKGIEKVYWDLAEDASFRVPVTVTS